MNYYELLKMRSEEEPNHLALVLDEEEWSYGDTFNAVQRFAERFVKLCPKEWMHAKERISVLVAAENFVHQLFAFLSLQELGICPILLHKGLKEEAVQAILRENHLQGMVSVKDGKCQVEATGIPSQAEISARDDIMGALTSGTTGIPKVLYRTYESWADFFPTQNEIFHVDAATVLFLHGSLSFTGNLNTLLSVMFAGGTVITASSIRIHHWEELIRKRRVNVIYLVPSKLQLLSAGCQAPLPLVQSMFTGSQLLSAENIKSLRALLPQALFVLYYGASELSYITYTVIENDMHDSQNLGKPFPSIKVTVQDGLVYVDTPYHASGIEMPFTVKDAGLLNDAGELIFEGRDGAWINKGGVKINTAQVECKLKSIRDVYDVAVVPIDDKLRGKDFVVCFACAPDADRSVIRSAFRQRLSPVEQPCRICFMESFPLNDRGKVDKVRLHEMVSEMSGAYL